MSARFDQTVDLLKAVAEPTRLRLVLLLREQDLTVSDLTGILRQSQPRVSRHLKLLVEAGVVSRTQEGAWAYFRLGDDPLVAALAQTLHGTLEATDGTALRDREGLEAIREARAERAATYFARNAEHWDRIRSLHAPEREIEAGLLEVVGQAPFESFLDVGTGTGRLLELLAPLCERAVGIDASREMLGLARAKLDAAGLRNATVRQADVYRLPVPRRSFDLVALHHVLHYLQDPAAAIREAAGALAPGGRLILVDFAPHDLEFLRAEHAHLRLGFSAETLSSYLAGAGLALSSTRVFDPPADAPQSLRVILAVAEHAVAPATPRALPVRSVSA